MKLNMLIKMIGIITCHKLGLLKNKGKESENSYQKLKRSLGQAHENTRKLYRNISTDMVVFINQKRVNVCEQKTKMASLESLWKVQPGGCEREIIWG